MFLFDPRLVKYSEHPSYVDNTYAVLENTPSQFLICRVEKVFWKFYKQTEREFKTWSSCVEEI